MKSPRQCFIFPLLALAAVSCRNQLQILSPFRDDGKPWSCSTAGFDSIENFALSPDGATLSFIAKHGTGWRLVISSGLKLRASEHGRIDRDCTLDTTRSLSFSPDRSCIGIVYRHASRWHDDGPHAVDDDGGQWFVDIDHHIFGGFDGGFKPALHFSPDGAKFGFAYKKLGQHYVQVVDTTFGPYNQADVVITKDGAIVLAYIKQDRACIETVFMPRPQ
jgi:hypothetical protein